MSQFPKPAALSVEGFGYQVEPCSLVSGWINVTSGLSLGTAPTYTRTTALPVDASFAAGGTKPFKRELGRGTNIRVRLVYDNAHTAVGTAPQFMLLGRRSTWSNNGNAGMLEGGATSWQFLTNKAGNVVFSLTPDLNNDIKMNVADGSVYRATTVVFNDHTFDCDGCDEFWLVPITAMAVTNGNIALARVEVKMF